jgi:hypothetical protein
VLLLPECGQQVAHDDKQKVVYLAGGNQLSALDASTDALPDLSSSLAAALPLLAQQQLPSAAADVAVCGGLVAVAADSGRGKTAPGQLLLYRAHDTSSAADADSTEEGKSFRLLANVTVGKLQGYCSSSMITHIQPSFDAGASTPVLHHTIVSVFCASYRSCCCVCDTVCLGPALATPAALCTMAALCGVANSSNSPVCAGCRCLARHRSSSRSCCSDICDSLAQCLQCLLFCVPYTWRHLCGVELAIVCWLQVRCQAFITT